MKETRNAAYGKIQWKKSILKRLQRNWIEPKRDENAASGLDEIIVWNFFEIVVFKNRIKFTELT